MRIEISDIGTHRNRLSVEADWESVLPDYEDLLGEYRKLPVPGFRPGKAPAAMVEKHFERPLLDETAARSVRRLSRKALDEEGIRVTGPISVTELKIRRGKPLNFTAEFTRLPDFDLPEYGSMEWVADTDPGMRDEISVRLLVETGIDIPEEMVREELLVEGDGGSEPGDVSWRAAEARVRLLLILGEIARREGIDVDDRDIDERIASIAESRGTDISSMKRFMLRGGGLSRLSAFLLAEKALDYLIDMNRK